MGHYFAARAVAPPTASCGIGVLYADIDLERVGIARRSLDVAGHYSRPDIFQLQVNTNALKPDI